MVSFRHLIVLFIALAMILPAASAMTGPIGGDQAWFKVISNVDGADVYFGGEYKGQTTNGELYIEYFVTGTPVTNYRVEKDGYAPYSGSISQYPGQGEVVDLYATLQPAQPTPAPAPIGGSVGWYTVYANVDGASVYFDNEYKGTTANGELITQVYTTGTPYQTYRVSKDGYADFTSQITDWPAAGETVKLHATLQQQPEPTPSPISLLTVLAAFAGIALILSRRKD